MIEVIRWVALGLSLFSMGFSTWTYFFVSRRQRQLCRENLDLKIENITLRTQCESYWEEIVTLREGVSDEGVNHDNE